MTTISAPIWRGPHETMADGNANRMLDPVVRLHVHGSRDRKTRREARNALGAPHRPESRTTRHLALLPSSTCQAWDALATCVGTSGSVRAAVAGCAGTPRFGESIRPVSSAGFSTRRTRSCRHACLSRGHSRLRQSTDRSDARISNR